MITDLLPAMMVALFEGGFTKVPPIGMWGGVLVAVLSTVAANAPPILTFWLTAPSMIPLNGCGTGMGEVGPGG